MTSGVRAIFNRQRVERLFSARNTLTKIAKIERVHRSVISKYLKSRGYIVIPSRKTGPLIHYNAEKRIAKARENIAKAKAFLAFFGLTE